MSLLHRGRALARSSQAFLSQPHGERCRAPQWFQSPRPSRHHSVVPLTSSSQVPPRSDALVLHGNLCRFVCLPKQVPWRLFLATPFLTASPEARRAHSSTGPTRQSELPHDKTAPVESSTSPDDKAAPCTAKDTDTHAESVPTTKATTQTNATSHEGDLGPAVEAALKQEEELMKADEEEEAAEGDQGESDNGGSAADDSSEEDYVTDHQRKLQYEKKVKHVERLIGLQEVLSKEVLQKCLNVTHVSTISGVQWQDISANANLLDRPAFKKQPEGFFARMVLDAVFNKNVPAELGAFVTDGNPLPHVVVGKQWCGLALRVSHEGAAAVQVSSLVDIADDSELRDSENARVRNLEAFYGPASLFTSADAYAHDLFGAVPSNGSAASLNTTETVYDEDTDTYTTVRPRGLSLGSRLAKIARAVRAGHASTGQMAAKRTRAGRQSPSAQSTLQHFSSKLTIVVMEEPHPLEAVLSTIPEVADEELPWETTERARAERTRTRPVYDANNPNTDDPKAPTLAGGPNGAAGTPAETKADASATRSPRKPLTRLRVLSIHRRPIPFLEATFANWPLLATSKLVAPLGVPAVDTLHDVIRLLVRGTVTSFQEDAYRATRQMEFIENQIYDEDAHRRADTATVAQIMAHLHVMSRRARTQEIILRDTQMAAMRLRALTPGEETSRDVQDQAFMTRCISLATHLEEHTESLLFLQFQALSNEMADNLRTLTIFSTFFIPLNFLLDVFNMRFDGLLQWCEQDSSLYVFIGTLILTVLGMYSFVRRHLQA